MSLKDVTALFSLKLLQGEKGITPPKCNEHWRKEKIELSLPC